MPPRAPCLRAARAMSAAESFALAAAARAAAAGVGPPAPAGPAASDGNDESVSAQMHRLVEERLAELSNDQGRTLRRYTEMNPMGRMTALMNAAKEKEADVATRRVAGAVIRARHKFDREPEPDERSPLAQSEHGELFRRAEREACPMGLLDREETADMPFHISEAAEEDASNANFQIAAVLNGEVWPPPNWMAHLFYPPMMRLPLHRCRTGTHWEEIAEPELVKRIRSECPRHKEFNALLVYMLHIDRHFGYAGPACAVPAEADDGFRLGSIAAAFGVHAKVTKAFREMQGVLDAYGVLNERPGPPVPEEALREMYDRTRDLRAAVDTRDEQLSVRLKQQVLHTLAVDTPEVFFNPLLHEHVHPEVLMRCANLYASRECQRDNYLMVADGNESRTLEELGARPVGWTWRQLGKDVLAPDGDLANIRIHIDMQKRRWLAFMLERVVPKWEPKTSRNHASFIRRYLPVMRRLIYAMAFLGSDTTQMMENELRDKGWIDMLSIFLRDDERQLDLSIKAMPEAEWLQEEASKLGLDTDVTHIVAAQPGFFVFICESLERWHEAEGSTRAGEPGASIAWTPDELIRTSKTFRVGMHLLTRVVRHTVEGIFGEDIAERAGRDADGKRKHAWYLRRYSKLAQWVKYYEDALGHHRRSTRVGKLAKQARHARKAPPPYTKRERPDRQRFHLLGECRPVDAPTTEFLGVRY